MRSFKKIISNKIYLLIKAYSRKRHFEKYNTDGFCPDFEFGADWMFSIMCDIIDKFFEFKSSKDNEN